MLSNCRSASLRKVVPKARRGEVALPTSSPLREMLIVALVLSAMYRPGNTNDRSPRESCISRSRSYLPCRMFSLTSG